MEEREAHDAMGKVMSCIDEGGKNGLKVGNTDRSGSRKQIDRIWKAKTI